MAKQTGLGDVVIIDDSGGTPRTISNDLVDYGINISQDLIDTTGLDKSARERITGMSDADVTLNGIFNSASNMSHDVFKVRTGARTFVLKIGGATTGNPQITMELVIVGYTITRGTDGGLTWTVPMNLQSGTVPAWTTVS
jgi:hypothetical protein